MISLRSGLFRRILFWFLIAMLVAGLGGTAVTILLTREGLLFSGRKELLRHAVATQGERAAALYEEEGRRGLRDFAHRLRQETELHLILLGNEGIPLTPGGQSPMFSRMVERMRRSDENFAIDRGMPTAKAAVTGPSGETYLAVGFLRPPPEGAPPRTALPLLWWFGLIVAAGTLFCVLLADHLARPMRRLQETSLHLAGGDLTARVEGPMLAGKDELAELGRSMNYMASRIEGLVNGQRRLLRDISHELRSPLARLQVALELARRGGGGQAERHLDRIELESRRMEALIAQLLSLVRLQNGREEIHTEDVDLDALLREIIDDTAYEETEQGRERVAFQSPGSVSVRGDRTLLHRAFENILRNALRHTDPDAGVVATLKREGDRCIVGIRDFGEGVPEEELQSIFDPFYRSDSARSPGEGGAGIGLAIVREGIAAHGGDVEARNAGKGLEVVVRLPANHRERRT
ncbi:MAG: HAMP domain-containing protein [Synergistales bacterium]|nr:HAMP domain-containing protein [Synergistales bacterium]